MRDLLGNPKKCAVCGCIKFNGFGALQFELVMQQFGRKNADAIVAIEDTISKSLTPVTETLIYFTQNHTECLNYKTLDNYIINCI